MAAARVLFIAAAVLVMVAVLTATIVATIVDAFTRLHRAGRLFCHTPAESGADGRTGAGADDGTIGATRLLPHRRTGRAAQRAANNGAALTRAPGRDSRTSGAADGAADDGAIPAAILLPDGGTGSRAQAAAKQRASITGPCRCGADGQQSATQQNGKKSGQ